MDEVRGEEGGEDEIEGDEERDSLDEVESMRKPELLWTKGWDSHCRTRWN
jgi:hypothetical protein